MSEISPTTENQYSTLLGQVWRFAVVGVINTAINFAILNLLSVITGIKSGEHVIYLSVIAFVAATTNSFYMNKNWSFHDTDNSHNGRKVSLFLVVSIIGAAINSLVVYLITTHVSAMFGFSDTLWLNVANLAATGVALVWNFTGYKLFVFKE
jgi:putative flippase GtrA